MCICDILLPFLCRYKKTPNQNLCEVKPTQPAELSRNSRNSGPSPSCPLTGLSPTGVYPLLATPHCRRCWCQSPSKSPLTLDSDISGLCRGFGRGPGGVNYITSSRQVGRGHPEENEGKESQRTPDSSWGVAGHWRMWLLQSLLDMHPTPCLETSPLGVEQGQKSRQSVGARVGVQARFLGCGQPPGTQQAPVWLPSVVQVLGSPACSPSYSGRDPDPVYEPTGTGGAFERAGPPPSSPSPRPALLRSESADRQGREPWGHQGRGWGKPLSPLPLAWPPAFLPLDSRCGCPLQTRAGSHVCPRSVPTTLEWEAVGGGVVGAAGLPGT